MDLFELDSDSSLSYLLVMDLILGFMYQNLRPVACLDYIIIIDENSAILGFYC